jgi:hypothetical protein
MSVVDFHHQVIAHAEYTRKDPPHLTSLFPKLMSLFMSKGTLVDIYTWKTGIRVIVRDFLKEVCIITQRKYFAH